MRRKIAGFRAALCTAVMCSLICATGLSHGQPNEIRIARGVARGADDGQPKYRIEFKETWTGNRMVAFDARYIDMQGRTLMRRQATWTVSQPLLPNLTVDYPRDGRREIVKTVDRQVRLGRKTSGRSQIKWKTVRPKMPAVNGATMHTFLGRQYEALATGKTIRFSMLAPSRLDWYRFRARKVGFTNWKGRRAMIVEAEPDAFLIRLFAKTLIFYMDTEYRVMVGYAGMVMVKDEDDDNYHVVIDFATPPGIPPIKAHK